MMIINFSATAAQPIPERDKRDIEEHHRIIDTLEKRDSELAEKYVREHILSAGQQLIHSLV
jgi:DNA-binding GntR family transcriptional regulator